MILHYGYIIIKNGLVVNLRFQGCFRTGRAEFAGWIIAGIFQPGVARFAVVGIVLFAIALARVTVVY